MILSEVIERIKQMAIGFATSPLDPRLLDDEVLIELILPRVFSVVTQNAVKDPDNLAGLRKDTSITFASGIGTLPDTIKEEYISSLYFPTIPMTSYVPRYEDFVLSANDALVGTFTVQNRQIYYRAATAAFGGFNGSLTVNAVTLPSLPTLISDVVALKDNLLDEVIVFTASLVAGKIPLSAISLDYPALDDGSAK